MVWVDFARHELHCKVVYYGAAHAGKQTILRQLLDLTPAQHVSWQRCFEAGTQTLRLDFQPQFIDHYHTLQTHFQVEAVTGTDYGAELPKEVISGADGVIFVADSRLHRLEANHDALRSLRGELKRHSMSFMELPIVFQWNKTDCPDAIIPQDLNRRLNRLGLPNYPTNALSGQNIANAFDSLVSMILSRFEARTCRCFRRVARERRGSSRRLPMVS